MQAFHEKESFMSNSDSNEKYFNSEYPTSHQEELFDVETDFLTKKSDSVNCGLPDLLDNNDDSISELQAAPVLSFNKLSGQRIREISELML